MMRKIIICILAHCLLINVLSAFGQSPMVSLNGAVDHVMEILKATGNRTVQQALIRHGRLWPVIQNTFDFSGVGRTALGDHWARLTADEQAAFSKAFSELVSVAYLCRVNEEIQNITIEYIGCHYVDTHKTRAKVTTRAQWKQVSVDVDCSMRLTDGQWRISDVCLLGISLADNWQTQLAAVLGHASPKELIGRIKTKVANQKENWKKGKTSGG